MQPNSIGVLITAPHCNLAPLEETVSLSNRISIADYYAVQDPALSEPALSEQRALNRTQALVQDGEPLTVTIELEGALGEEASNTVWVELTKLNFEGLSDDHWALFEGLEQLVKEHDLYMLWAMRGDGFIYLGLQRHLRLPGF